MRPINKELFNEWEKLSAQVGALEDQIIKRIDYIVQNIFKIFGVKLINWSFYGAGGVDEDGEDVRKLQCHYNDDGIEIEFLARRGRSNNEMVFIDKFGHEYGIDSEIPTRWLYDDNFQQEIIAGIAEYKKRKAESEAKQKALNALKKIETEKLVEEAKKKLSKKELAALRRSL